MDTAVARLAVVVILGVALETMVVELSFDQVISTATYELDV